MLRLSPALLSLALILSAPLTQASEPRYNQISLRAEVSQEVAHDVMQVTLYREAQESNPAKLAQSITQALNAATLLAQKAPNIKVSTGNRHSYAIQDEDGQKIIAWRERGELILESQDFAALSTLTGELLNSLSMGNLSFTVSNQTRLKREDELIQQAVEAFKARAQIATQAWGGKEYRLINLSLDSGGYHPIMRAEVSHDMAFKAAAPVVASGSSQIRMSASGTIEVIQP